MDFLARRATSREPASTLAIELFIAPDGTVAGVVRQRNWKLHRYIRGILNAHMYVGRTCAFLIAVGLHVLATVRRLRHSIPARILCCAPGKLALIYFEYSLNPKKVVDLLPNNGYPVLKPGFVLRGACTLDHLCEHFLKRHELSHCISHITNPASFFLNE
jgi:hypothetical protein